MQKVITPDVKLKLVTVLDELEEARTYRLDTQERALIRAIEIVRALILTTEG